MCYTVDTMDRSIGIRELRQQASRILKDVVKGEAVIVTDRGHPIARIVPLQLGTLDQLIVEGRATQGIGDLLGIAENMELPAETQSSMLPSEALAKLRIDER